MPEKLQYVQLAQKLIVCATFGILKLGSSIALEITLTERKIILVNVGSHEEAYL